MKLYKVVLSWKQQTKPQNNSATAFPILPWNNSDTEHPSALGLVFLFVSC